MKIERQISHGRNLAILEILTGVGGVIFAAISVIFLQANNTFYRLEFPTNFIIITIIIFLTFLALYIVFVGQKELKSALMTTARIAVLIVMNMLFVGFIIAEYYIFSKFTLIFGVDKRPMDMAALDIVKWIMILSQSLLLVITSIRDIGVAIHKGHHFRQKS